MVQLGRRYGSGPASLTEIAQAEDLPRAYLEQLVMSLRDAGLVTSTRGARGGYELSRRPVDIAMSDVLRDAGLLTSTRGARGGYSLARPPADIQMSEVLRALEGPLAPMICATDAVDHDLVCDRTSTCTVNFLWIRVRDAIAGALDTMTLADLVPARRLPGAVGQP